MKEEGGRNKGRPVGMEARGRRNKWRRAKADEGREVRAEGRDEERAEVGGKGGSCMSNLCNLLHFASGQ